jgi:hypothetical protein
MGCAAPKITVGGVTMSTSVYENSLEVMKVGSDLADPTADEREDYIANGKNTKGSFGMQPSDNMPTQTASPDEISTAGKKSNNTPAPGKTGINSNCAIWDGVDYDYQLSTNFKLRDFTINALFPNQVIDYKSYTKQARFCNLLNVAVNIAEPMRSKFGTFNINSGLRNSNSTATGLSQHCVGQAIDIQFPNWSYDTYWQNAQWIKDNIPYDQFIFEHGNRPWLHLSFSMSGGRAVSDPHKVMTMWKGQMSSGLRKLR